MQNSVDTEIGMCYTGTGTVVKMCNVICVQNFKYVVIAYNLNSFGTSEIHFLLVLQQVRRAERTTVGHCAPIFCKHSTVPPQQTKVLSRPLLEADASGHNFHPSRQHCDVGEWCICGYQCRHRGQELCCQAQK